MTDSFETRLKELAQEFDYPATPQIAEKVMRRISVKPKANSFPRKLAWSLTILLIVLISLMSIPPVRAAVLEFIQIGVVRIFPQTNGPTPEIIPIETKTPSPTPVDLIPLLEMLIGETTLEDARTFAGYPISLPTYPHDLGDPDRVFTQDVHGTMTILVWMDDENPGQVKMSLHMIPPDSWAIKKTNPTLIELTTVNGHQAVWATGPYPLLMHDKEIEFVRMIQGHVLIWTEEDMTYRLETDLSLEEAIKIAESLQAPPVETPTP